MMKERKPLPESANQASGQDRGMHRARTGVYFFNQPVEVIFWCCIRDYLSLPGDARRRVSARTPMNRAFPLSSDGDSRSRGNSAVLAMRWIGGDISYCTSVDVSEFDRSELNA